MVGLGILTTYYDIAFHFYFLYLLLFIIIILFIYYIIFLNRFLGRFRRPQA